MEIINKEKLFEGYLKLSKYNVEHNGTEFEREFIDMDRTVCALIHNIKTDKFVFVKQFRPGSGNSELIELCGGWVEKNDPVTTIQNEILEETGYKSDSIELMFETYFVPGYSREFIGFYYVMVSEKIETGGGLENEGEFIEVVELTKQEIRDIKPEETDAKTLMALSTTNLMTPFYVKNYNIMTNPDDRIYGC